MFNSHFTVTTNIRSFKVAAVNKFRAADIATARLEAGETIVSVVKTNAK